jgi:uncharacterized membrane protein YkvA (DUF1232 family)
MDRVAAALAIVVAVWLGLILVLVVLGRRTAAREISALVPNLTRLFAGLLRDPRVPRRAKVVLAAALAYLAFPLDLVPDFIPVAGSLDDAIVAALALRYVLARSPGAAVTDHWRGDPATLRILLRLARAAPRRDPGTPPAP